MKMIYFLLFLTSIIASISKLKLKQKEGINFGDAFNSMEIHDKKKNNRPASEILFKKESKENDSFLLTEQQEQISQSEISQIESYIDLPPLIEPVIRSKIKKGKIKNKRHIPLENLIKEVYNTEVANTDTLQESISILVEKITEQKPDQEVLTELVSDLTSQISDQVEQAKKQQEITEAAIQQKNQQINSEDNQGQQILAVDLELPEELQEISDTKVQDLEVEDNDYSVISKILDAYSNLVNVPSTYPPQYYARLLGKSDKINNRDSLQKYVLDVLKLATGENPSEGVLGYVTENVAKDLKFQQEQIQQKKQQKKLQQDQQRILEIKFQQQQKQDEEDQQNQQDETQQDQQNQQEDVQQNQKNQQEEEKQQTKDERMSLEEFKRIFPKKIKEIVLLDKKK